ncbi:unnamed protein product [Ceratitis capitata]|uniref:(Mediterranean fruit fly) hypothetical protein n=1 Tax=Ceratitis capitata TaxID=7213 RepID=A0A811VF18_CERCA|nr:unnamed protein product [Ceratitis capitata]
MSLKKDFSKVEYRIKLLSGNNVVLVEANGFESEIFVPEIQNGRISFQNIIPNRRCCFMLNALASKNLLRKKRRSTQSTTVQLGTAEKHHDSISPSRTWRLHGGDDISRARSPLAFSTPAPAPSPTPSYTLKHQLKYTNKENYRPRPRTLAQAYHTIELLRAKGSAPIQFAENISNQTPCTKTVRIQCEQSEIDRHLNNTNCLESGSGFNIPDVPNITPRLDSPVELKSNSKSHTIQTPGTVTKWRKCLTPIRTYSRHGINVPRLTSSSSVKNARSPERLCTSTTSRKKFEISKKPAFDMLTAPSRARMMSAKLTQQFKKSCVNKASSTYPKYKILCKIPPLEREGMRSEDRQDMSKVNINRNLPPSNVTVAAMMEKACSNAIQSSNRRSSVAHARWCSQ